MKKRIKICFVLVNRANYGRVKLLMSEIKKNKNFQLQIVLVSSPLLKKYGQLDEIIKKDGFKINSSFFTHVEGENLHTMTKSTALCLLELSSCFKILSPDIVFTIGDRYESLATAIAASYSNIYLCHLQGGELSGSIDDNVRHAVTKLSNLHLVATERSKKIVKSMGENPKNVFNVGSLSVEKVKKSNVFSQDQIKEILKIKKDKKFFLITYHPSTLEIDKSINELKNLLEVLKSFKKINLIFTGTNDDPNSMIIKKIIDKFIKLHKNAKFVHSLGSKVYISSMNYCDLVIGNSSSGILETPTLKKATVNIGNRQKGRIRSKNIIDTDERKSSILRAIIKGRSKTFRKRIKSIKNPYGIGKTSRFSVKILKKLDFDKILIKKFHSVKNFK